MNLISKKDLLVVTGISYGQLYRWKRQQLIPEEWFIKKASYTGQETFFPREQIISRIETILQLKDQYSMEQLAAMFAEDGSEKKGITPEQLLQIEELPNEWRKQLPELTGKGTIQFDDLAAGIFIANQQNLSEEDKKDLLSMLPQEIPAGSDGRIGIFQSQGQYHLFLFKGTAELTFDSTVDVLAAASWSSLSDPLKIKYKDIFKGGI